jgi:hypothetical protein
MLATGVACSSAEEKYILVLTYHRPTVAPLMQNPLHSPGDNWFLSDARSHIPFVAQQQSKGLDQTGLFDNREVGKGTIRRVTCGPRILATVQLLCKSEICTYC